MNIVVSAAALRTSGALTIYRQFLEHLIDFVNGNKYFIIISEGMPAPKIDDVIYIISDSYSGIKRVWFDMCGCMRYFKKQNIKVDCVISLQNTSINTKKYSKRIIYYHQSLPFYPQKWSLLKKDQRKLFLYKYFYPIFVKAFLRKDTQVIVQIPFIKRGFIKYFHHPEENVKVFVPDIEKIDVSKIEAFPLSEDCIHLIYPATAFPYKNHRVLFDAIGKIVGNSKRNSKKIKLHLTIERNKCPKYILDSIMYNNIFENVCFDGIIPHNDLLRLYKAVDALVFPSTIETFGLPLIEAASMGKPIIASDLDYAREVLGQYKGVSFVPSDNAVAWSDEIMKLDINSRICYLPIELPAKSSWEDFFNLINFN